MTPALYRPFVEAARRRERRERAVVFFVALFVLAVLAFGGCHG